MAVTGTLAKLKNYFMGWHDQEYDYLHKSTSDIATETNPNKTATTQAIKDYVASQQYDDTDVLNQILEINNKLGTTSTLPTPNNITTSINTLSSTVNVLNRAASTTQNGYIKASDYKKLMNASYTASYTNNEKTILIVFYPLQALQQEWNALRFPQVSSVEVNDGLIRNTIPLTHSSFITLTIFCLMWNNRIGAYLHLILWNLWIVLHNILHISR